MMATGVNLIAGWASLLAGALFGAALGLFFHDDAWLGGYGGWRRRLIRLAHVSFFGLGLINILYALDAGTRAGGAGTLPSVLLVGAGALMPPLCLAAAFRPALRHLLALPVAALIAALSIIVWRIPVS